MHNPNAHSSMKWQWHLSLIWSGRRWWRRGGALSDASWCCTGSVSLLLIALRLQEIMWRVRWLTRSHGWHARWHARHHARWHRRIHFSMLRKCLSIHHVSAITLDHVFAWQWKWGACVWCLLSHRLCLRLSLTGTAIANPVIEVRYRWRASLHIRRWLGLRDDWWCERWCKRRCERCRERCRWALIGIWIVTGKSVGRRGRMSWIDWST